MKNKGKNNRMRFFASCLVLAMCLSMVDTNLLFPVSAEGDAVTEEPTQEIEQTDPVVETTPEVTDPVQDPTPDSEPTVPEETVTPEQPEEPTGDAVTDETVATEEAVQPEADDKSVPAVMSVAALEAARENSNSITQISVLDTEKTVLSPDNIKALKPGWVRESGVPESQAINGRNYTFKDVEVDGQPVLYTAVYEGQVFYSFDGASGKLLEDGKKLDIVYWEYFDVNIQHTGSGTGKFEFITQSLEYPQGTGNTALKAIADSPVTDINQTARIYKGMKYDWSVSMDIDQTTDSRYVINSISKNDVQLDNAIYKNGGSFSEEIDEDTVFDIGLGLNTVVKVTFNSSSISSEPKPSSFKVPEETNPINFTITRKLFSSINKIYIQTDEGMLEFDSGLSGVQENGKYSVQISGGSFGSLTTYDIKIQKNDANGNDIPIYEDIVIYTDQDSKISALTTIIADQNTFAAIYKNGTFTTLKTEDVHLLNNFLGMGTTSLLFVYKSKAGYTPNAEISNLDGYSVNKGSIDSYKDKTLVEAAKSKGYTHYISITKTNWYEILKNKLIFSSTAIPIQLVRENSDGSVLQRESYNSIDGSPFINLTSIDLTQPESDKVFAGYALNGKTDTLYPADSVFTLSADTWNLGELKDGVQTFTFTPQYHEADSIYLVYHHRQNDKGEYDLPDESGKYPEATVEIQTGVSPGTTGYVIGIPKEYEGYTFDAVKSQNTMGIQLSNGKPVDSSKTEIHLYYAKDIQHGNLSIHNHVSGDLANKNKQFSYQIIAEPAVENFPFKELTDKGFKSSSNGGQYVKSVSLSHDESDVMNDLPITNCTYTVNLTTDDSFYTTSKAVRIDGADSGTSENSKTHTFDANSMTPNASHEVHFTHTAQDVVPTSNIFDDNGFDLVLASTATLALLCGIYAVVRKKLRLR